MARMRVLSKLRFFYLAHAFFSRLSSSARPPSRQARVSRASPERIYAQRFDREARPSGRSESGEGPTRGDSLEPSTRRIIDPA